ncbi:MAG: formyltetrahydrofolate deformylase [Flavobacteriales bacterium]|nr:formyltetrahydrofolate deformylase [Flavobacteriia bacterium]NCP06923.1 formyltetrahydrofolate deformylase [Flavobacteriales bacterium]PIV94122.1 MAG: formyltetrahydrofolate deformylase [Flavobacteriaceae bacterium CG17_big_fil_post_rev_8_21_14_2_50_33_15]PIY10992.1 MAG: formyltetrahydrofolate deformylase [Flavobacteriaceae bacterium CG_4_10_14_3_um_filter_33_47]PJB17298.1 MAG: formyltetrahydrofolate deformylase [Flavobacteriaceae bacterium CG_4_9_14_3_um_filter_33_16]
MNKITLLMFCKDRSNIIASVTNFIANNGGNIVYIDQHVDREQDIFFMRLESEFEKSTFSIDAFKELFKNNLVDQFKITWRMYSSNRKPKMALFVSKYDHCLYDILGRYNSGELFLEIPFILSNHLDLKPIAESFKIPFFHVPVTKETKQEAEQKQLELLTSYDIDFIVLARYMQIVSETLIHKYPNKIINIHHSFLPAFVGAKPYHSAYKRGVKIIGATSHYVTEELDAGPIIEQGVARVSHTHSIEDLIAKGRDLEKIVLANAIKLHTNRKVLVYNNKTIIFS